LRVAGLSKIIYKERKGGRTTVQRKARLFCIDAVGAKEISMKVVTLLLSGESRAKGGSKTVQVHSTTLLSDP